MNEVKEISIPSKETFLTFCDEYLPFLEEFYNNEEIRNWCLNYNGYDYHGDHQELHDKIYEDFMLKAYDVKIVFPGSYYIWNEELDKKFHQGEEGFLETLSLEQLLAAISLVIRSDHTADDLPENVGNGTLLKLFKAAKARALEE